MSINEDSKQEAEGDRKIIEYLWDKWGSRTFNRTSLVPRDMVEELHELLPEQDDGSTKEDAIENYLYNMTLRDNGEYQVFNGERMRIVVDSRPDWKPNERGFRVERV